jgi:hypothetical protein
METIPSDTLAKILELRTANGLEATESAVYADLEKSKCKWTLTDTPRYRRAGASPLWISGKYLSSYGSCPATGEADQGRGGVAKAPRAATPKPAAAASVASKIDESAFYKVLHAKGFAVKITQDLLTGKIETQVPDAITKLDLQFSAIPANAAGIHVSQTSPQIQISMPLDRFLEIAGIRP